MQREEFMVRKFYKIIILVNVSTAVQVCDDTFLMTTSEGEVIEMMFNRIESVSHHGTIEVSGILILGGNFTGYLNLETGSGMIVLCGA